MYDPAAHLFIKLYKLAERKLILKWIFMTNWTLTYKTPLLEKKRVK